MQLSNFTLKLSGPNCALDVVCNPFAESCRRPRFRITQRLHYMYCLRRDRCHDGNRWVSVVSENISGSMLRVSSIRGSLYLVPGSIAPLEHVYSDSENILLLYSHGWARLWDLRAQEFRRSVTWDKAADIVSQDQQWVEMWVL